VTELLGFALEALQPVRIRGHRFGWDFDGHLALQGRVASAIHRAQSAFAKLGDDFVHADSRSLFQAHGVSRI
jgi:hypothetical protein